MTQPDEDASALVDRARRGDRIALDELVRGLRPKLWGLACRMLGPGAAAEDATQEILVLVVTRIGSFRGESAVSTWAYRIAMRHLVRERRAERRDARRHLPMIVPAGEDSFESLSPVLRAPLEAQPTVPAAELRLLEEEVFEGCTQAMLLALDPPHRAAFILGGILELDHRQGAAILECSPVAFRKRLSRARSRLHAFLATHCGWVSDDATCRCAGRVQRNVREGNLDLGQPRWARLDPDRTRARHAIRAIGDAHAAAALYRTAPQRAVPASVIRGLERTLAALVGSGPGTRPAH